ncbi:hypothetical protein [Streptomyces sp. CRN 30]|uniref:hypothetical protein n=1 Tax=Streptomyces sp. CRN 30 TaxID=3075613 RepID=UPI002A7ECC38|nr:hypothetical protein [Streptomyces sp. CRN 30]
MGHTSIEETYCTYRHLVPGSITKAVRILDAALRETAWPALEQRKACRLLVAQQLHRT